MAYDVVYSYVPGPKRTDGTWRAEAVKDAADLAATLERVTAIQGRVAHPGCLSIGAPEGPPTEAELAFAFERSQKVLSDAFDLVKAATHWKAAISTRVTREQVEAVGGFEILEAAVIHFSGSVARIEQVGERTFQVEAAGYWAAVGS